MDSHGVLIAGGGLAGQRCAERLRRRGYDGPIRMVCAEPHLPYDRPPLSKELLAGETHRLFFRNDGWYADNSVELLLGERAAGLEAADHRLLLESGESLRYDHLLVATGATPRMLRAAARFTNSFALRTMADAHALRESLVAGARLAVVGAGFIGLEVASTARKLGVDVTIIEAAARPLEAVLGEQLGNWLAEMHADEGVSLFLSTSISEFRGNGRVEELVLSNGGVVPCDALVVAIGVAPAVEWVGSDRPASLPDVHAAGDATGGAHWEAAAAEGAAAADAMLGEPPAPRALSSFWSDQYGVRIQYLGDARHADSIAIDGDPSARNFTAVFTQRDRPVAALLAGRPRALPEMRRLIAKGQPDELPS
jgi:NADPH-dependent 2,4-dienoyl-CoA reductase/sulfur reductase-like enzyme